MARERELVQALVELADTLVDDYDAIDFLQALAERCVELVDVTEAGIMLADAEGKLRYAACSSERMRLVELFELQLEEGPCFDAYRSGKAIFSASAEEALTRWPRFAPHAIEAGLPSVSALPMRLRADVIGSLNLFSAEASLTDEDLPVVQALADIATIGILQARAIRDSRSFSAQLEAALDSRVVIEQAKGILAEHSQISVDDAFVALRAYSRAHNRLLSETAREVIQGSLHADVVTAQDAQRRGGDVTAK
jgi:GAF domain-containing protein